MELKNLDTFIHVAELGSFTKAATQLGYSQSTVSFQIKQLEQELDCLLFERINHTVTLTQRGRELVAYAHQVRTLTDGFMESLSGEQVCSGNIRVVAPDSICEKMINERFLDFHREYPDIFVRFTTGDSVVMLDMLDHNEADVIITLDQHIYNKDYIIVREQRLPMHFVASSQSRFAGKKALSVRDILGEPFVLTEYGQGYRRVFDRELAKRSLEIVPALEIGRTDMITQLVAQSDMISFLPDFVTQPMVQAGQLCYLDVADIHIEIWKQLIYHRDKWVSKSLKAFIDYVSEAEFTA